MVTCQRIVYTKPIAIVVNPFSGKKRDVRAIISKKLEMEKVPFEFLLSTR